MTTDEKRYYAYAAGWDSNLDEEIHGENVTDNDENGRCMFPGLDGWDTLEEFAAWYDAFPADKQLDIGAFYVYDLNNDERMLVDSGTYDLLWLQLMARNTEEKANV